MSAAAAAAAAAAVIRNEEEHARHINRHDSVTPVEILLRSRQFWTTPAWWSERVRVMEAADWTAFSRFLGKFYPGLTLDECTGPLVVQFLEFLNTFSETQTHYGGCPPSANTPCQCPLQQNWEILDGVVRRLRHEFNMITACYPDTNPFSALEVIHYLRDVREAQIMGV